MDRTEQQEHIRILCLDPAPQLKKRNKNSRRIAQIIGEQVLLRPGNYSAFFPSFDYLEEVSRLLAVPGYQILMQERWMPDHARENLLDKLAEPGGRHLVVAVQGGIFAEGVDYPGEKAIGAFIVGPALPKVSFELELMRDYFEAHYSQGFEYAYLYPGMNRVVQSAGRIIRTEADRGIILLMDKRFASEIYSRHLPEHWYESSPTELVSQQYVGEISRFCEGVM
jgi:DNA excision repair protein ERCC-2